MGRVKMKSQRYLKHLFLIILIAVVLPASAGAAAYLSEAGEIKVKYGKVKSVGPHGNLIIKRPTETDFSVKVGPDAAISKDGEVTSLENISVGDFVKIKYFQRVSVTPKTVVEVEAEAFTIIGEIIGFDRARFEVTINGHTRRTFKIGQQTVILLNGSIAGLTDIRPGSQARVELDNETPLKIARLKLTR